MWILYRKGARGDKGKGKGKGMGKDKGLRWRIWMEKTDKPAM